MPFQLVLNYRRGDAAGNAGRLRDALVARFGEDNVFMDIDTIEPGVDFVEAIERAVGSCDVFLALIGQQWLTSTNQSGLRRLDDPDDFVRLEIEAALRRGVRVIPVLVQDVEMPTADQLPESLAPFARRNAIEIRDATWRYDAGRLIETLTTIEQQQPIEPGDPGSPQADGDSGRGLNRSRVLLAAAVVALLIGAALVALLLRDGADPVAGSWDRVAFAANGRVFTVDIDGSDEVDLTRSRSSDRQPDWSPDGQRLVLARAGDIFVVDASGDNGRPLTSGAEFDNAPDWSPDGTRIAFDRAKPRATSGTHDVWVMNADGTLQANLTDGQDESGAAPDWSGDGTRIVFQRRNALWWMRADGSEQQRLSLGVQGSVHEPDWSPQGNEVVFALYRDKHASDIYLYDLEQKGRAPVNLTPGQSPAEPTFPAWSSDASRVVFAAAKDGIYTMNRDGSALTRLTQGPDIESPSWRPPRG
ncbi:MAG TPA: TIR domain-containing protein [Gaiellaceae bacterium]|nr:TIR domain-containing protein [Gaiellaceae bacterium]